MCLFWWLQLCSIVWCMWEWFLQLIFFFKMMLAIQVALCFYTNFKIICSSSVKSVFGILLRITLLGITLTVDCTGHFNKINSSNPRIQYIFPSICVILNFLHWCLIAAVSNVLVPGTGFIGRQVFHGPEWEVWFRDDSGTLHLLCTLYIFCGNLRIFCLDFRVRVHTPMRI